MYRRGAARPSTMPGWPRAPRKRRGRRAVETCATDQTLLDKLSADQKFAYEVLKVDATPTFFINGERLKGAMSFEELDEKIKSLLKNQ